MTFQTFIETKYPLYSDPQMKVNLTVQQVCELVEEWENMPKKEVEICIMKSDACGNCAGGEKERTGI